MLETGTLHLICGRAGSGKTTYAKKLEQEKNAIRFSKDEWIIALYGRNIRMEEWGEFEKRCYGIIANIATKLLQRGVNVILDYGLWYKKERLEAKEIAQSVGANSILHYLNTSDKTRRERINERNLALGKDAVEITDADFSMQLNWFEIPSSEEGVTIIEVKPEWVQT